MIKLVIIDFDDTLSLTEKACFKIENLIAQQMGFAPMDRETHLKNWGKPLKEAIVERFPGIDADKFMVCFENTLPEFIEKGEVDFISEINFQTLDKLKKLCLKLAILTSRSLGEIRHLMDTKHPLNNYIDAFYHKENLDYVKPDPKVFDKALEKFQVKLTEAVYIGDSLNDAISAKNAGLHFIALLESGLRTKEYFKKVKVDFFANKFSEIIAYITTPARG